MASARNGTLYVGVTSNLAARVYAHNSGEGNGFTARYDCNLLLYFEMFDDMAPAIAREKQLKGGSRAKKLALIEAENSGWRDLYSDIL
jgi:putative endonuclease